jgi:hypothetical protein
MDQVPIDRAWIDFTILCDRVLSYNIAPLTEN